jgi:coniferyl-aldehyde dehydrogenase
MESSFWPQCQRASRSSGAPAVGLISVTRSPGPAAANELCKSYDESRAMGGANMSAETISPNPDASQIEASMLEVLERQRAAQVAEGPPSAEQRIDRIDRAIGMLVDHEQEIVDCLAKDFGHRSHHESLLTNVVGSIEPLKFAKKNLRRWMRPKKRKVTFPLGLLGARAEIRYQPVGVVGIISPWNFPVNLTLGPMAGAFAAGNRMMIKPSEFTPETSSLMARMFASVFDEMEVATFTGGPEVGRAFSGLPFDHLLFTGATGVGRHVMHAAAENLVPVTLELGGKSPVIVSRSAKLEDCATKIMAGKLMNAGQICLAPDYVFVPEEKRDEFVGALEAAFGKMFSDLESNPDYTSIVNQSHSDRLEGLVEDARSRGARVVELNPANEKFNSADNHKMAPVLIVDPDDDATVMQQEIFGPVLPIKTYQQIDEVIDYVNDRPRPLGLYYFGKDAAEQERVLSRTSSGGVTINDVIMHVSMEDLPFGGIGPSGMGSYHGREGFAAFSHARSVLKQAPIDIGAMMRPPYGEKMRKFVKGQIKR